MKLHFPVLLLVGLLALTSLPAPGECARILALLPFLAKSHWVTFSELIKELSRRGHEVVFVSSFPQAKPMANLTDVDISGSLLAAKEEIMGEQMYDMANMKMYQMAFLLWGMGVKSTADALKAPEMKNLLNDKKGFDLVIVEAFMNEAAYGFADHFKAPLVLFSPFGGWHWLNYDHGNPAPTSYVPNAIMAFSDKMTFCERFFNTIFTVLWDVGHQLYYLPKQEAIRKELFGEGKSVWELQRSVSLTLLNNHFSLNYPRPLLPSIVEVGGLHVSRVPKKLPDDIQKFLDEATDGAIYFSMGSNLRSDQMPPARRDAFLAAFSELNMRVIWKWESEKLPGQPKNVKLGKWLPQQDILAHPNVRLFITHGGLLSAQEAVFHGVPLVGIPVFGDQSLNSRKAQLGGYGVMIELKNVTKQSISWAIAKALEPSIRQEARRRSMVYRDQPESPLDRAVFWTEYVLRHKGAPHLRSAATHLAWYQLYLLDVAAAILLTLTVLALLLRKLLSLCCGGASSPKPSTQDKKKKKQ